MSVLSRRSFCGQLGALMAASSGVASLAHARPPAARMTVYKDPNCGCCRAWISAMQSAGFEIDARDTNDLNAVKTSLGVPAALASCHTGVISGYVFEGHVPPDLVTKVLRDKPAIIGLFVPGMPAGSVGMEMPNPQRYDIIALSRTQGRSVYATRMGRAQA
jgi:hypothetical protein